MKNHFILKRCKKKVFLDLGFLAENNDFIIKRKLRELNISPLEALGLSV